MRLIGTIDSPDDARRFSDYLLTIGLRNHIEPSVDGRSQLVWIEHDDHIEQGQLHLREYLANPNAPQYAQAPTAAARVRKLDYEAAQKRRRNYTDVRTSWAALPRHGATVTLITIGLCTVLFVLQQTRLRDSIERWLLFYKPVTMRQITEAEIAARIESSPEIQQRIQQGDPDVWEELMLGSFGFRDAFGEIARGQVWRLVTPAFMHANVPHILFNCWSFLLMGSMIEARRGRLTMLTIILLGAILSCCAQAAWDAVTPRGGFGFVGLSGVVYAVFGYAWMRGRTAPQERVGVNEQYVGMMLGWLVICMTGWIGPIANAAHVVGLLVGMAIGLWPRMVRTIRAR